MNRNRIETKRGRKQFVVHRLNIIRFRNAKRNPLGRRDIL